MNAKTLIIAVVALLAVAGISIVSDTVESEADVHNGNLSVTAGQSATWTWNEVFGASYYSEMSMPVATFSLHTNTSNSSSSLVDTNKYDFSYTSTSITLSTQSSLSAGTYYIFLTILDEQENETIVEECSRVIISSSSGGGSVSYTSPSAVDALTGSQITYRPTVNVANSTFTTTTVNGKTNASWLSFNGTTLTGTAPAVTAKTTAYYSIKATTPGGQEAIQTVTFTVFPVAKIDTSVQTSYSLTQNTAMTAITLSGNVSMTWGKSGELPAGVSLSDNKISGTPTNFGTFTIKLEGYTIDGPGQTATKKITFTVAEQSMSITSEAPTGIYYSGKNYIYSPTVNLAAGATWTLSTEYDWLVLSNGVITGTIPSDINKTSVSYTITATSAGGQTKTQTNTITVEPTAQFTSVPTAQCLVIPEYTYSDNGDYSIASAILGFLGSIQIPSLFTEVDAEVTENNLSATVGQPATWTWDEVFGASYYNEMEDEGLPTTLSLALDSTGSVGTFVDFDKYDITYTSNSITLTTQSTLEAGTYYIQILIMDEQENETLTEKYTKVVISAASGGSSDSGSGSGSSDSGSGSDPNNAAPSISETNTRTFKFVWTGENATRVFWDFGDGVTAEGNVVYHTYKSNGYYKYSCYGTNDVGTSPVISNYINVNVPSTQDLFVYILIVIVIIVVAIIAVFIIRKKKQHHVPARKNGKRKSRGGH